MRNIHPLTAILALCVCGSANCRPAMQVSLPSLGFSVSEVSQAGPEFRNPPVIRSRNGVLKATLVVEYTDPYRTNIGPDNLIHVRSYNGRLVGPTLRVRPGDTIKLHLIDRLPPESSVPPCCDFTMPPLPKFLTIGPAANAIHLQELIKAQLGKNRTRMMALGPSMSDQNMDTPHGFNSTNLHTHGLHVSPSGQSDNVFVEIKPGHDFYYTIHIPLDQPAGTYWYHAHKHGAVAVQLASGMSGAIIVDGGMDSLPAVKAARERIFVFQQLSYLKNKRTGLEEVECFDDSFGPGTWQAFEEMFGRRTTINGLRQPVIRMHPGAVERWRFIHTGIREEIEPILIGPIVAGQTTSSIHSFYAVAYDGISTGQITPETKVTLAPAYREDVFVQAPSMPGTYYLWDGPTPKGLTNTRKDSHLLATVVVYGNKVSMTLPKDSELTPYKGARYVDAKEVTGHQSAIYGVYPAPNNGVNFFINNRTYSMNETPRKLYLGDVDEWDLKSDPTTPFAEPHPFHIHVNSFQITSIDGFDPFLSPLLDQLHGELWKDTLLMQPGCVYHVRMRYEDFTGKFVDHCHILDHEDQGMMENVEILPRRNRQAAADTAMSSGHHIQN